MRAIIRGPIISRGLYHFLKANYIYFYKELFFLKFYPYVITQEQFIINAHMVYYVFAFKLY